MLYYYHLDEKGNPFIRLPVLWFRNIIFCCTGQDWTRRDVGGTKNEPGALRTRVQEGNVLFFSSTESQGKRTKQMQKRRDDFLAIRNGRHSSPSMYCERGIVLSGGAVSE